MPIPIPLESGPPQHLIETLYVRDRQSWAIEQERQRHDQAMYLLGEYVMFALMWHIEDFTAGLVNRCTRCFVQSDALKNRVAVAYKQPTQNKCIDCFGTTFEGGYKALIIRPSIFTDTDKADVVDRRGIMHPMALNCESTSDFRVRTGDFVFRSTGDRFYLRTPQRTQLRTGFETPTQSLSSIDYNMATAQREDLNSVAYIIGPTNPFLTPILNQKSRKPIDFSAYETVRAPLIPDDNEVVSVPPAEVTGYGFGLYGSGPYGGSS